MLILCDHVDVHQMVSCVCVRDFFSSLRRGSKAFIEASTRPLSSTLMTLTSTSSPTSRTSETFAVRVKRFLKCEQGHLFYQIGLQMHRIFRYEQL